MTRDLVFDDDEFGFGGKNPAPAASEALTLADTLFGLIDCREALREAQKGVPDYTGRWSREDYTAEAREAYNRAADAYHAAVRLVAARA
jgi:hypothetical protein